MIICFFTQDLNQGGGVERSASLVMNALACEEWCKVYSLTYGKGKNNTESNLFPLSPDIHRFTLLNEHVSMKQAIFKEHVIRKLKQFITEKKVDILIACGELFFPVSVLVKNKRCRVICWDHTNPLVDSDQQFQRISRFFGFRKSDVNVLLTKSALDIVNSRLPRTRRNNVQIANPIDPLLLQSSSAYKPGSHKIISVGRLDYAKNFDRLLDIAQELFQHKETEDWTWDIYGDGSELDHLLSRRDSLKLQNKVFFKGKTSSIYDLYPEYAMYVMTSRYEGQPMTLLEATAKRLPLISFDILTGPSEIIVNGENGFLCNKDSNKEMIERILYLINNEQERIRISDNSMKYLDQFHIERIIRRWKKLMINLR